MDEETLPLHGRLDLEQFRDLRGLDYSPSPMMCRSRRSMKRDESKETYKLPHRLIEKKRRDRINECIAQLKDLLPEHLKLTTLGHLEKAVVLELTLKHVKTLTALMEQQHQKIIALQNGDRSPKSPPQSDLEAFHSGFPNLHQRSFALPLPIRKMDQPGAMLRPAAGTSPLGLHAIPAWLAPLIPKLCGAQGRCSPWEGQQQQEEQHPGGILKQEPPQPHCVPVIQRTQNWGKGPAATHHLPPSVPEQGGEHDTDTDSGYGGECEGKTPQAGWMVKREPAGDGGEDEEVEEAPEGCKRRKLENPSSPSSATGQQGDAEVVGKLDSALLNPLVALGVGGSGGLGALSWAKLPPLPSACLSTSLPPRLICNLSWKRSAWRNRSAPLGGWGTPPLHLPRGAHPRGCRCHCFSFPRCGCPRAAAEKGSSLLGAATAPSFPGREPLLLSPLPGFLPRKPAGLNPDTDPSRPSPKARSAARKRKPLQRSSI